jgi:hypothetical protein
MNHKGVPRPGIFLVLVLVTILSTGIANAETRTAAIGEKVPLSGTAIGEDIIYLFMTGPGVPSAGSRMDSSVSPVVTGNQNTFTQVPVYDGHWNYTWNTARVSGGLAEGQYTIYSATQPVSVHDLSGVPYSSIDINLNRPVTTGGISVRSSPSNAQVMVNGKYSGNTPLNLTSLTPGNYEIEASIEGYLPGRENVTIEAGDQKMIDFNLQPSAPATVPTAPVTTITPAIVSTTPPPATKAPFPVAAVMFGLCLGAYFCRIRGSRLSPKPFSRRK